MILSKTIRLFLESIGRSEETEFYLRKFQDHASPYFALVIPDAQTLAESVEVLAFDLEFLLTLGLKPALVVPVAADTKELRAAFPDGLSVLAADDPAELVPAQSGRVQFLRARGQLHTISDEPIFFHYTERDNPAPVHAEDTAMAERAEALLAARPGTHISISSPLDLLREMFPVRGAGTMVRRGSTIHTFDAASEVDHERLLALLLDSFGRPLTDPSVLDPVSVWHIESGYHGAALLEDHAAGKYLSKFAVMTYARGEGLAGELWSELKQYPALFWRARPNNPINPWYLRQSDGHQNTREWIVFWRGIASGHLEDIIDVCTARPAEFVPVAKEN